MNTPVICADDHRRILDFLQNYRPVLDSDTEQITILTRKLQMAEIVPQKELSRHVVSMYSAVRVVDLREKSLHNYTLVYPYNAISGCGHISLLTPLGTALLGSRVSDTVTCPVLGEPRNYSIWEVLYQPEWDERNRFRAARLASPN